MYRVTGEHQGGQQPGGRGGGGGGGGNSGHHQSPMAGRQQAVQEERVEAVEEDVHCLEAPGPGLTPGESVLSPVGQGGHWPVGLKM